MGEGGFLAKTFISERWAPLATPILEHRASGCLSLLTAFASAT